jgi:predicted Zn-dependent peptidase
MLATLLTGGRTSRLHRRLVLDEAIAGGVFASLGPGELHPQLFQIDASPVHPHSTSEVEAAIYEEIARLGREGPTDSELERVRNQVAAGAIRSMQSNLGLAFQLAGGAALHGDWRAGFRAAQRLRTVTAEDVARVAAAYLHEANRTVATLVRPEGR